MNSIELLRLSAYILAECKHYPISLKIRALKEAKGLYRMATGNLKGERGTITLKGVQT